MRRRLAPALAFAPLALHAQTTPTTAKPGWQWSMDSVRTVVNAVRAGRALAPASWPGGARVAVRLSFDVDNETIAFVSPSAPQHSTRCPQGSLIPPLRHVVPRAG